MMRRSLLAAGAAFAILATSCGANTVVQSTSTAGDTTSTATPTTLPPETSPAPTTTSATTVGETVAASSDEFCQATTELNAILLLSAFSSLTGEGAQDLFLLAKLPELAATSAQMAASAPSMFAGQAATLADFYDIALRLATESGLATSDLEALAARIDAESLTVEQLFAELGLDPTVLAQLFEDAARSVGDREPPDDLLGAEPADLGCAPAVVASGACGLLGDEQLSALLGDGYTAEPEPIEGLGETCTIRGADGARFVQVTLAGPTFYLPSVWNEIEMISGIGDEAFVTVGLSSPFLYAKQGDVVVSVSAANFDPAFSIGQLSELARTALASAVG